jgi:hypothetical protein
MDSQGVFTQSPVLASQPKQRNTVELSRIRGQIRDLSGRFQDLVNTIAGTAAGRTSLSLSPFPFFFPRLRSLRA